MNDMQSDTSSLCVPFTSNNVSRNALDIAYYYHNYIPKNKNVVHNSTLHVR